MTELPQPPTHCFPPALEILPRLRRPASRLRISARVLRTVLRASFPVAEYLTRDPNLAERMETTPYDHLAADTIVAVNNLIDALDELAQPITIVLESSPTPDDNPDLDF